MTASESADDPVVLASQERDEAGVVHHQNASRGLKTPHLQVGPERHPADPGRFKTMEK
jgi:hypothetical protein